MEMKNLLLTLLMSFTAVSASADLGEELRQHKDNAGKERQWLHTEQRNRMTDEVTQTVARLENPTRPWGTIVVVNRKESGVDASFAFYAGVLDCPKSCSFLVRADDSPARSFEVSYGGSGGDNAYVKDPRAFIDYVRNAKRILVQFRFVPDPEAKVRGQVIAEFNTDIPLTIRPLTPGAQTR